MTIIESLTEFKEANSAGEGMNGDEIIG